MGSPKIAATLQKFNRKERFWVIQNAFGAQVKHLCPEFLMRLSDVLSGRIAHPLEKETAWWAIDYHLDWLAGALYLHTCPSDPYAHRENQVRLIKGQQEDIDLVVASGSDVILIEAKAFSSSSNKQLKSKLQRLQALCDNETVIYNPFPPEDDQIRLHCVLMSRSESRNLGKDLLWSRWTVNDQRKPFRLNLETQLPEYLTIGRCNNKDEPDADGEWSIIRKHRSRDKSPAVRLF